MKAYFGFERTQGGVDVEAASLTRVCHEQFTTPMNQADLACHRSGRNASRRIKNQGAKVNLKRYIALDYYRILDFNLHGLAIIALR
jgi:hypothetical protein